MDVLMYSEGPRVRDRISHGEVSVYTCAPCLVIAFTMHAGGPSMLVHATGQSHALFITTLLRSVLPQQKHPCCKKQVKYKNSYASDHSLHRLHSFAHG